MIIFIIHKPGSESILEGFGDDTGTPLFTNFKSYKHTCLYIQLPLLQDIIQFEKPFLIPQSHKLTVCGKRYCTVLIKYTIGVLCILAFFKQYAWNWQE